MSEEGSVPDFVALMSGIFGSHFGVKLKSTILPTVNAAVIGPDVSLILSNGDVIKWDFAGLYVRDCGKSASGFCL